MTGFAIDDAAWGTDWRRRATAEKVLLSAGLAAVALASPGPVGAAAVLLASTGAACAAARIPVRTWCWAISLPASFVLVGVLGIVFTLGAPAVTALWAWGPLSITEDSLLRGLHVAVRSLATTSAVILLATTTPMPYLLASLGQVPGLGLLAEIANVVYRMIFSLMDTQARIRESQAARLGYGSGATARRSFGMLGAAILIRAWTAARRLDAGLAGRGYDGSTAGLVRRRPVSIGFVMAAATVVAGCAALSTAGPRWWV